MVNAITATNQAKALGSACGDACLKGSVMDIFSAAEMRNHHGHEATVRFRTSNEEIRCYRGIFFVRHRDGKFLIKVPQATVDKQGKKFPFKSFDPDDFVSARVHAA